MRFASSDDALVFVTKGERVAIMEVLSRRTDGQLVSANDSSVVFKSGAAGQVTIEWKKVQELHTSNKFALIPLWRRPGVCLIQKCTTGVGR